ncbi:MAG: hypothetical protein ACRCT8_16195 [Lacipirellulaceae bacterium]
MAMIRFVLAFAFFAAVIVATPGLAVATVVAADDASNSVYDMWTSGDNGGTGFTAWNLTAGGTSSQSGFFAGDSRTNGDGDSNSDGDINSPNAGGRAWGLYANSGALTQASRGFNLPTATPTRLSVNHQLTLSLDTGFIQSGGSVGFGLQNSSGSNLFEFFFKGGDSSYTVSSPVGTFNTPTLTGVPFTDEGLVIRYTVTAIDPGLSASDFRLQVDSLATPGLEYDVTGFISAPTGAQNALISTVRLFNFNAGTLNPPNAFFNSITITAVPEPTAAVCVPLAGVLTWMLRSRRSR